jgi:hypothetical protein
VVRSAPVVVREVTAIMNDPGFLSEDKAKTR